MELWSLSNNFVKNAEENPLLGGVNPLYLEDIQLGIFYLVLLCSCLVPQLVKYSLFLSTWDWQQLPREHSFTTKVDFLFQQFLFIGNHLKSH